MTTSPRTNKSMFTLILLTLISGAASSEWGVDVSWPYQRQAKDIQMMPSQVSNYMKYMNGCKKFYSLQVCEANERGRIRDNADQPHKMINYTSGVGYKKIRAPERSFKELVRFWNKFQDYQKPEVWPVSIFTNHWHNNTKTLLVNEYAGPRMHHEKLVVQEVQEVLEAWTGQKLELSSIYGIRSYQDGNILAPHIDRIPLITSAIINVAQDVREEWPLEVIGHDRITRNITMEPGDMVVYESHSVLHGRPYPLHGNYYANVRICFS